MPAELESAPSETTTGIRVSPSAPIELGFALYAMQHKWQRFEAREPGIPWVAAAAKVRGLRERVSSFWGDGGECGEIGILADRSGTLCDESIERFFDRFDAVAASTEPVPPLPTETEHEQAVLTARIERLAASPELRAGYLDLLKEVWSVLEPFWRRGGQEEARRIARDVRERITAANWRDVIECHLPRRDPFAGMVDDAIVHGRLTVVPLVLSPEGGITFLFPGTMLVAFGTETRSRANRRKELAQRSANSLKLFSDPTRLTILMTLLQHEASITELADLLDVSQPTVSVHVKMLREAELLEADRRGSLTFYRARPEVLKQVFETASGDILGAPLLTPAG